MDKYLARGKHRLDNQEKQMTENKSIVKVNPLRRN